MEITYVSSYRQSSTLLYYTLLHCNHVTLNYIHSNVLYFQTSPNAKLDKADILELTVRHLTLLQQQQASVTMATQAASYSSGYKDCAQVTIGYIRSTSMMNETSFCSLSNHLHNSFLARTGSPPIDQMNAYQRPNHNRSTHLTSVLVTDLHIWLAIHHHIMVAMVTVTVTTQTLAPRIV